ncbi:RDD family protein [Actinokineospora sp. HUAS TT18]|uniref:RDD family protein n=1 Tax=Actinokineospora sp. HUAS TT18 TaxID=3447451 RepID=UPI003F5246EE
MSAHRADLERTEVGELGEVAVATPGGRFAARVIDTVVAGVPGWLAAVLIWPDGSLVSRLLFALLVVFAYEFALVAVRGTTPGKSLLRIEIADLSTGAAPSPGEAFLRTLVFWAVPMTTLSVLLIDERLRRGWHDLAAGTIVVLRPSEG